MLSHTVRNQLGIKVDVSSRDLLIGLIWIIPSKHNGLAMIGSTSVDQPVSPWLTRISVLVEDLTHRSVNSTIV